MYVPQSHSLRARAIDVSKYEASKYVSLLRRKNLLPIKPDQKQEQDSELRQRKTGSVELSFVLSRNNQLSLSISQKCSCLTDRHSDSDFHGKLRKARKVSFLLFYRKRESKSFCVFVLMYIFSVHLRGSDRVSIHPETIPSRTTKANGWDVQRQHLVLQKSPARRMRG